MSIPEPPPLLIEEDAPPPPPPPPPPPMETLTNSSICRKQKRKILKKLKRKQIRKETALKEKEEEESRLNDEEEQRRILLQEKEEQEMIEKQRREFEEREKLWMERVAKKAKEEEEEARRKVLEAESRINQDKNEDGLEEDDDFDYVEEGPAEIIWQGNEIIVKKKRVKVAKTSADQQARSVDADMPTTNPLPPQSEAYEKYRNTSVSDHQVFESVSQQNPNFGTEQDKKHCPFQIKTGACRFGVRCSRAHFYPDKSCTLLIKNLYNGPGLAWEQDEGLECTDEEIDHSYEEFYEDVHTEFLKFGEIVNFKVCKNGSGHLRGNVYVHYKSLESAILAYDSINGRYFAGKQITCEYVGVTRWRVAICGEYMKSRFKMCSRGTVCNFIHCFRNPGGDYEWADWDNPPPKYWVRNMAALFGPSDEVVYDKRMMEESGRLPRNSKKISAKHERYHSGRSRSRGSDYSSKSSSGEDTQRNRVQRRTPNRKKHSANSRKRRTIDKREQCDEDSYCEDDQYEEKSIVHGYGSGDHSVKDEDDRYEKKSIVHDHGSGDHSIKDMDGYYSRSRPHSHQNSSIRAYPDSCENVKDSCNARYKRKDRLRCHNSNRNCDDLSRVQKGSYSSRREHVSGQIKAENICVEHKKSEEYGSDSPRPTDRRYKSHDSSSGPNFSETVDPCDRWETGSNLRDASEQSRSHGSDDNEPCTLRHIPHDHSSGGRQNEIKSGSQSQSRRWAHLNHERKCSDSPSVNFDSDKNRDNYSWKHSKRQRPQNEGDECCSSGEKLDIEQKEACDLLKHKSRNHHLRELENRCYLQEDWSKRSNGHTKRKRDNSDKNVEDSGKWSRSRSPVLSMGRSRRRI